VMAHIRGESTWSSTNVNYPKMTDLSIVCFFAAATLRATNGSKHIDFEF
jgi:hypothetical protein